MTQQIAKSAISSSNDVALLADLEAEINASLMKDSSCFESDEILVENQLDLDTSCHDGIHNCNTYLPLSSIPGFDAFQNSSLCLNSSCNSVMTILEKAGGTMSISTTNDEKLIVDDEAERHHPPCSISSDQKSMVVSDETERKIENQKHNEKRKIPLVVEDNLETASYLQNFYIPPPIEADIDIDIDIDIVLDLKDLEREAENQIANRGSCFENVFRYLRHHSYFMHLIIGT